jgi:hypothetical protein
VFSNLFPIWRLIVTKLENWKTVGKAIFFRVPGEGAPLLLGVSQ